MATINHNNFTQHQNHLFNNHPHYPYITNSYHLCGYGETPTYTLFSPLFQSFNHILLTSILENYYSKEYIKGEKEIVERGERKEEYLFDIEDLLSYLTLEIQTNCKTIIFMDNTGEILFEIPLTKENLNKKIEELLPNSFSINTYEVYAQ